MEETVSDVDVGVACRCSHGGYLLDRAKGDVGGVESALSCTSAHKCLMHGGHMSPGFSSLADLAALLDGTTFVATRAIHVGREGAGVGQGDEIGGCWVGGRSEPLEPR